MTLKTMRMPNTLKHQAGVYVRMIMTMKQNGIFLKPIKSKLMELAK